MHLCSHLPSMREDTKKLSSISAIFLFILLRTSLKKLSTHGTVQNSRDEGTDEVSASKVEQLQLSLNSSIGC